MKDVLFQETQRLRQWWIWAILGLVIGIAWWTFGQQIVFGQPFGTNPWSDVMVWIIFGLFGIGLPLVLILGRFRVTVHAAALRIHFAPIRDRWIPSAEIKSWEVVTYKPIRQWGGWGIRWRWGGGWAYTVHGDRGVQLVLDGDKRLLVGSQRPEELAAAIAVMVEDAGPSM